uniref:Putative ovule protein n=1 Tax=Solanum chacoense TaxID=4108 RepID=A0A0V0GRZ6_SOLCH
MDITIITCGVRTKPTKTPKRSQLNHQDQRKSQIHKETGDFRQEFEHPLKFSIKIKAIKNGHHHHYCPCKTN